MTVKVGDIISMVVTSKTDMGKGNHYRKEVARLEVIDIYKHHVLCKYIASGIRECFTWWDLKQNFVGANA